MAIAELVSDALDKQPHAIGYYVSRRLRSDFPDEAILEGVSPAFNLEAYALEGLCTLTDRRVPHPQRLMYWAGGSEQGNLHRAHNMWFRVGWQGELLQVLIMHWPDMQSGYHYFILAGTNELAEAFHSEVCAWNTRQPDEFILVFDVNGWNADEQLLAAIKNATLDNLVLHGSLKSDIVSDLTTFFDSRDTYARYGVPWKRGILFVGPAGNGKTHAVKALVNALDCRCVYVKTFAGQGPDQMAIRAVFQQARSLAPCILVLEDLDSLITHQNRSYFLNELDGFAGNDGIVVLATTNHPDRLDPAILDRPSRFDRKYPFDLPGDAERTTYIAQWNASLQPELRSTDDALGRIAEQTDGFSFAYLKELFLSAMMRWISTPERGSMDSVMVEQVMVLREQMASLVEFPADPDYGFQYGGPDYRGGRAARIPFRSVGPSQHPGPQDIPL